MKSEARRQFDRIKNHWRMVQYREAFWRRAEGLTRCENHKPVTIVTGVIACELCGKILELIGVVEE